MDIAQLRQRHPKFVYKTFSAKETSDTLIVTFDFFLEPDIHFHPRIAIPKPASPHERDHNVFLFHLGLIEAISYWKATCSSQFIIEAGFLTNEQVNWWKDLFLHGLGEFFYQNNIDFTGSEFLNIIINSSEKFIPIKEEKKESEFILVGGGKDSAVTLELLQQIEKPRNTFILNTIPSAMTISHAAGYTSPIIVERIIDPKLLELNSQGYLNGHTPFSAYLAFLSTYIAFLHGYSKVIASNEKSAAEGNTVFHSFPINHQYSKSYRFEKSFRDYSSLYLSSSIEYFSFLRPLYDLQIAALFSKFSKYHSLFYSCNVGGGKTWCGNCAKCAFVFLSMFPFLSEEQMKHIFGSNFFEHNTLTPFFFDLAGLGNYKPFECVGTKEETIVALTLSIKRYLARKKKLPSVLVSLDTKLHLSEKKESELSSFLTTQWDNEHFLPRDYEQLLKKEIQGIHI